MNNINEFTFGVLAYNHENYIIEHLESIKYLVINYAKNFPVHLIINDDCSSDGTINLVDCWLVLNAGLFSSVIKLYNKKNVGTCESIVNVLKNIDSQYFKVTAGDDVFSFENIFELSAMTDEFEMVSAIPLNLVESVLFASKKDLLQIVSSAAIYKNKALIERFIWPAYTHPPSTFYPKKCFDDGAIYEFIGKFKVVEDWPMQISIAEKFPKAKFFLCDKVFVYYRRTMGSTYIIRNNDFSRDKGEIFSYLAEVEKGYWRRICIKNRAFCFSSNNKIVKKIFNISLWIYAVRFLLNLRSILKKLYGINLNISIHDKHYAKIAEASAKFINEHYAKFENIK